MKRKREEKEQKMGIKSPKKKSVRIIFLCAVVFFFFFFVFFFFFFGSIRNTLFRVKHTLSTFVFM